MIRSVESLPADGSAWHKGASVITNITMPEENIVEIEDRADDETVVAPPGSVIVENGEESTTHIITDEDKGEAADDL